MRIFIDAPTNPCHKSAAFCPNSHGDARLKGSFRIASRPVYRVPSGKILAALLAYVSCRINHSKP